MKQTPTTAVLLAAGRGKRLRPLTDTTPKPLLPVNGRVTLDYVLVAAARAGIQTVCLVTHHLGEQIERYVGDGSAWGLTAVCCRQPQLDGTGGALRAAVAAHPQLFERERPFLLTATDYALPPDFLTDLVAAYLAGDSDMIVSLKQLPPAELVGRSSVAFAAEGRIARIVEKPSPDAIPSSFAASLTFVLPGAVCDYLPQIRPSPRGEYEIQSAINQMLQQDWTASGLAQPVPPEFG